MLKCVIHVRIFPKFASRKMPTASHRELMNLNEKKIDIDLKEILLLVIEEKEERAKLTLANE